MKRAFMLIVPLVIVICCRSAFSVCTGALNPNVLFGGDDSLVWPKWVINNADCTPVRTDARKAALISSTTLTNVDFIAVAPDANMVAAATTTFNCVYDGNSFTGDIATPMPLPPDGRVMPLRMLLTRKFALAEYLVEIQKELTASQALTIVDVFFALKIQRLKSMKEFWTRVYGTL